MNTDPFTGLLATVTSPMRWRGESSCNRSSANLQITKCIIAANVIGMGIVSGGSIISGGDNFVSANGADGSPTLTVGLKYSAPEPASAVSAWRAAQWATPAPFVQCFQ